jgi:phosphate acyltransferase
MADSSGMRPIAVDVMGGDLGPEAAVLGALEATRESGIPTVLVGDSQLINDILGKQPDILSLPISVHHASQVITMEDTPSLALRGKADASVRVAFELVEAGKASAVVSPGNTGAIMAAGLFVVGSLLGVARPAIASFIPRPVGGPTILLDSGANAGCQAHQLVQFALMGHHYANTCLGRQSPRIALLSNGTEASKGNDLIRLTSGMLSEVKEINFTGFIEGRDIAKDVADVVVCDGFVGNIVLKAMEGTASLVFDSMKICAANDWRAKIGLLIARPALRRLFRDRLDPSAYGGAPLLGLGCVAIKCHGSSSSRAIANGVRVAKTFVDGDLLEKMRLAIGQIETDGEDGSDGAGAWARSEKRRRSRSSEVQVGAASEVKSAGTEK